MEINCCRDGITKIIQDAFCMPQQTSGKLHKLSNPGVEGFPNPIEEKPLGYQQILKPYPLTFLTVETSHLDHQKNSSPSNGQSAKCSQLKCLLDDFERMAKRIAVC